MTSYCAVHKKLHESFNWKYVNGEWFCQELSHSISYEFMPERIKKDRVKHFKTLMQPYRAGVASKEFIEAYGDKHINPEDAKKARYVWKDQAGWATRDKSL